MIDPLSSAALAAVLARLLDGAAGAAGEQAVSSLKGLLQRAFKRSRPPTELERIAGSPRPQDAAAISDYLVAAAQDDAELAHELATWVDRSQTLLIDSSNTNWIGGNVSGTVVQAQNISGPVDLG